MAEKPKSEKKAAPKAEHVQKEDKVLVIPLRHQSRKSAKNMRKNRAVREIRAFLSRHMKVEASNVSISQQLNESLWKGGLHNTPARIKVKVSTGEEGKVFARLMEEKEKPKSQKKKLGIRERLSRRRTEGKSEPESKAEPKEKPAAPKPEEKKPEPKELPKEAPPEEEALLEQ